MVVLLGVAGLVGFSGVAVRVQGIQSIQGLELQGFGLRIPLVRHALGARDAKAPSPMARRRDLVEAQRGGIETMTVGRTPFQSCLARTQKVVLLIESSPSQGPE